jgi:hypothetical protein
VRPVEERRVAAGPLAATFGRLPAPGDGGLDLSARIGRPDGPGWITAAGLICDHGLLEELLSRIERGCGAGERAYAGTSMLRSYLWRILTPAVAVFLLERRLPDLRAENVALRFGETGFAEGLAFPAPRFLALPGDPEAGHPDAEVLPSEEDLLARMRETFAQTHLPALIPALRDLRVRRERRALWRAGADVCAEAFMFVGEKLGLQKGACAHAETMLSGDSPLSGPTNFFVLEQDGRPKTTRVRNTCCLYCRVGDGACFTCPRTTNAERIERRAAT